MNILVCIKQVPGSSKVEVDPDTGVLKRNGADSKMNPYDLYALETGLWLRETYGGRGQRVLQNPAQVNDMFMAINDEDFTTMLPVLWLAACRNTSYYWLEPKWAEIGASYDWTGAFNRLVDSVREGLRNEQGAVEYRPEVA